MHALHPLLKPGVVEFRGYQANLARAAVRDDTLVVIPTGMGKTVVAGLVLADALQQGAQRILILAPTRPLVEQHGRSLRGILAAPWDARVRILTGNDAPAGRAAAYQEPGVIVATPQVVHNDLVAGRLDVAVLDWVVFDEAHRAQGDYPYVFIASRLNRPRTRTLALTASPGHDAQRIQQVRDSLHLARVEIRTPSDPDVAPYVQEVAIDWETLPVPPGLARVASRLQEAYHERIRAIKGLGFLRQSGSRPNRRDLLQLAGHVQATLKRDANPAPELFTVLSLQAQAMKLQHAIELAETQGAAAFLEYLDGVREEASGGHASKATQSVLADARVNEAYHIARLDTGENPKLERVAIVLAELVEASPAARAIVFTHFRSTCETVVKRLGAVAGLRPVLFVGQARKGDQGGLTQKQQAETVRRFTAGEFNVLVATSVAEEGLDIPETDLVLFYEPIASEIRSIQRRGRTGRQRAGRVLVLMNKGTQDEAAHWVSRRREQAMVRELQSLRAAVGAAPSPTRTGAAGPAQPPGAAAEGPQASPAAPLRAAAAAGQQRLPDEAAVPPGAPSTASPEPPSARAEGPSPAPPVPGAPRAPLATPATPPTPPTPATPALRLGPPVRIVCDHREQAGGVVRHLHELGAQLEFRTLDVGDYVLSDRVVAERKACRDFVDSLLDGRLFDQLRSLQRYPRPLMVLEGESLAGHRHVSTEAIMGALASVAIDYGIPVLQARDALETARLLHAVARREQQRDQRKLAVRPGKPAMRDAERQRYLLCGLPGVSDVLATRLLDHFGSVAAVMRASQADLAAVEGLGPVKAAEIRRILDLTAHALASGNGATETV